MLNFITSNIINAFGNGRIYFFNQVIIQIMTQQSIDFLKKFEKDWETFKAVGIFPHLATEDSRQILAIAYEIDPKFTGQVWCQSCLEETVRFVFKRYDEAKVKVKTSK